MITTLQLVLKVLALAMTLFQEIRRQRLTQQATEEMMTDLMQTADYLVTRANLARAEVKDTDEAISEDPFNRD